MQEKPFENANKLMRSGTRVNLVGTVGFLVLGIISGTLHNTLLLIIFIVLAVLCASAAFFLILAGARRNNATVKELVREAKAEQQRRING